MKLPVCDELINNGVIRTDKYCAPVFIASSFFGTFLCEQDNLVPIEFNKKSIRNGTMTFFSYKNNYYAVTCRHVLETLEAKQKKWREEHKQNDTTSLPLEGYELFTPVGKKQSHFNYKLTLIKSDISEESPDIAIARITHRFIKSINREAITLKNKKTLPKTGIASGYPEEQREIKNGKFVGKFIPKFTTCTATLQVTANNKLIVQDKIDENDGLNSLSGISGGPIIWADKKRYGLAGIIKEGLDIKPKKGGLIVDESIWIHGERITPIILEKWLENVPDMLELKNETRQMIVPKGMDC